MKIIRIFYYRNILFTNGKIVPTDITTDVVVSLILFYVVTTLSKSQNQNTDLLKFMLDTTFFVLLMLFYVKYIDNKNKQAQIETYVTNVKAQDELQQIKETLPNYNISHKPVSPLEEYMNVNTIDVLCLLPYFTVFTE